MKNRWFGSGVALLASAGMGLAQTLTSAPRLETNTVVHPVVLQSAADCADAGDKCDKATSVMASSMSSGTYTNGGSRFPGHWASAEYLIWWIKKGPTGGPLVTGGPTATSGVPGDPDTVALFDAGDLDYKDMSGARLTLGTWLDDYGVIGLEGRGFYLGKHSVHAQFNSDVTGRPSIGFPFSNVTDQTPDFFDFATPGDTVGRVTVSSFSRLWGAEANVVTNLVRDPMCTIDLLAGFRYMDLRENLTLAGSTTPLPGVQVAFGGQFFDPPAVTSAYGKFETRTHFVGGQFGVRSESGWGPFVFHVSGKLGLGNNHQVVDVSGVSSLTIRGIRPVTLPGAIYSLPSNIGRYSHDDFSVLPELELRCGYRIAGNWTAFVGYNVFYWSLVARPGDQINRDILTSQVPTSGDYIRNSTGVPAPLFKASGIWAQGVSFGVECKF